MRYKTLKMMSLALMAVVSGCDKLHITKVGGPESESETVASASLNCTAQTEEEDYQIFPMTSDGYRIGDVMPYFEPGTGEIFVYYLKDIWDDPSNERHPWYGFTTTNFYEYDETCTDALLASSDQGCDQDFAVGTGSVIKKGGKYYAFYTGHNPNYPSSCVSKKEGVMLATSNWPNQQFTKKANFSTIYPPTGLGFDEQDNFRDPFVYEDTQNNEYVMLISARKDVNGTWKGVLAKYTSGNLLNWTYDGVFYDGGADNYFMMECAEVFKINSTYYLLFSDIDTKYVYYRKSSSANGPWSKPTGIERFEGKGIYAAKSVSDGYDRYLMGWTHVNIGHTDGGAPGWGGNLVVHKIYQKANGDLAVTIPHTVENHLETTAYSLVKNSQWGDVTNTQAGSHSYRLYSPADYDMANVIFDPVMAERYEISATVNYVSSARDFGFMIGACDGWNDLFSLRFVPQENRFSFDKTNRSNLDTSTVPDNDVPFALSPGVDYSVRIVIENSMVVVYINDEVALSSRIYRAPGTNWGIFADHSDVTFTNIEVTTP